jgi:hypothetical protein
MPGGSDETIQSLFEKAIQFRTAESHAYYLRTPLGASLHYWNARTRTYEKQVLTGRDIYDMQFGLGRLAWIANYKDRLPELWLVSDRPLNQEEPGGYDGIGDRRSHGLHPDRPLCLVERRWLAILPASPVAAPDSRKRIWPCSLDNIL